MSEVLSSEPSGLSREKLQFDYFLLSIVGSYNSSFVFKMHFSPTVFFFFFNTLHLRRENDFVPRPPVKLA